jgi:hypothetical protein
MTRSGKGYYRRKIESAAEDDDDAGGVGVKRRGKTRSGTTFTRENQGYYTSMSQLKSSHRRLFSPGSTMSVVGEYNNAAAASETEPS